MKYKLIIFSILLSKIFVLTPHDIISPGILYKNLINDQPRQSIHILIVDPKEANIIIGIANDKCASAEKISQIAKKHNAIAAINGGFFDFGCKSRLQNNLLKILDCLGLSYYNAFPVYTLVNNNVNYSISHFFTGAISWNNYDQKPLFGTIKTNINLIVNEKLYEVCELNKPHPVQPTLYSSNYDQKTPSFSQKVDEIIIENEKIKAINKLSSGKTIIPKNGWVYALPEKYRTMTESLHQNDTVLIRVEHNDEFIELISKDNILASTPLLIYNDQIISNLKNFTSTFYTKKHPRSAIGILRNGNWIFIVVDGRQKHSEGFTILELAEFMKELGCSGALNLDGGGSSTMIIKDKVVNSPSGREYSLFAKERPVSNALLICSK